MFEEYDESSDEKIGVGFYIVTAVIALAVIGAATVGMAYYFGALKWSAQTPVGDSATLKTREKRISSKNKEAAKAAWNSLGELNSIASVGSNYAQYTSSLQTAKIKFDAAIRDIEDPTADDQKILKDLAETMQCYMETKEAWTEFLQDGDEYGFLLPRQWSQVDPWAAKYGYSRSKNGYFRDTVMSAMLKQAGKRFSDLSGQIR